MLETLVRDDQLISLQFVKNNQLLETRSNRFGTFKGKSFASVCCLGVVEHQKFDEPIIMQHLVFVPVFLWRRKTSSNFVKSTAFK